ncbi:Hypothetical protein A7982_03959 [Minicystis rosea]|nr:Hypothetical protein A7982_03959 [Minicystis rosea]
MTERGEGAPSRSEEESGAAMVAAPSIAVDRDARTDHDTPYTAVHRLVRRFLEPVLDVLIVALALALLLAMVRSLVLLVEHAIAPSVPVNLVLGETLFVLVLVELFRLLLIYLRDHHVSVDVMVEVTIVGTLRHVLIQGPSELPALQLFAVTAFILALGLLLRFGDLRAAQQLRSSRAGQFRTPPLARSPAREHPRHFGPATWSAVRSSRAVAAPPGPETPDRAR